ncbi:MAG TPA: hypothetical protein VIR63_05105 [Pontiella sp.]
MLALDFEQIENEIIRSNGLYPLHVPLGGLKTAKVKDRPALVFQPEQGLSIPHSTLLDPDGKDWVVAMRVFVKQDGLLLSQGNDDQGYAIFLKDGLIQAVVFNALSPIALKGKADAILTNHLNKWIWIELRIQNNLASLTINRQRMATVPLNKPFAGENMHIRLGNDNEFPDFIKKSIEIDGVGFSGALSALKILRQ